jgi:hypothetical protein
MEIDESYDRSGNAHILEFRGVLSPSNIEMYWQQVISPARLVISPGNKEILLSTEAATSDNRTEFPQGGAMD